jgi:predicted nucleotidyltransferase
MSALPEDRPEHRVAAHLAGLPRIERIWLFGSRARGDAAERSDIDLAVEAPAATPAEWHAILARLETAPTLLRVDVTRLEEASDELREEILRTGRVILERR